MADSEYSRRTAVTGLSVDSADAERLVELVEEWRRGCQLAVNEAWGECHTRSEVQQLAYDRLRAETDLGSQHAVLATHRAAEAIKAALERAGSEEGGDGDDPDGGDRAAKPEFTSPTVSFDTRTMTVFDDRTVSLTTTDERVRCALDLPADGGYQARYLDDDAWEPAKSTLHYRDGEFTMHLGFRTPRPARDPPTEGATVLGVHLDVDPVAVTSTAQFFSGGALADHRREFEQVRASLLETGTRSAARTLREAGTRIDRHARQRLHEVAEGIVAAATRYDCDLVAVGELDAVHERLPDTGPFHAWLFERLLDYVTYRADEAGVTVVEVNPEYTTQRCMECGFTHPQNRDLDESHFECLKCGASANDAYNAAKNVAFRCVRRGPLSSRGLGASACALRSGVVTPDDGFTPYEDLPTDVPRSE